MNMPRIVGIALATACLLASVLPASSLAADGAVPPGVAGANQYTESVPSADGNESTKSMVHVGKSGGAGEDTSSPSATLGSASAEKLEDLGPEGRAAANLAAAGASGGKGGGGPIGMTGGGANQPDRASSGSSSFDQVVGQLSGSDSSGGIGLLLPLLIVMAVVAAAGYLVGRRRTLTQDSP